MLEKIEKFMNNNWYGDMVDSDCYEERVECAECLVCDWEEHTYERVTDNILKIVANLFSINWRDLQ